MSVLIKLFCCFTSNNGVIYKYRCCEIAFLRFKYGVGGKMEDDFPILSILKVIAVYVLDFTERKPITRLQLQNHMSYC
jgi:hypothetical protein